MIIFSTGVPYEIVTYTSNVRGAGTEADVYVVLYGRDTCTSKKSLCPNKKDRKKLFEKGQRAQFVIEVSIDSFVTAAATLWSSNCNWSDEWCEIWYPRCPG